ncbi:MAG: alanine racemase, partial [Sphingomonadaceae bacterium]
MTGVERVPPAFGRDGDGRLLIAGRVAEDWVSEAGDTPLFLYDAGLVRTRVAELRDALPAGVAIHYAVKANPFAPLLQLLAPLVDGFDVASAGELALVPGDKGRVGFAGPGKRDRELAAAIAAGATISLESPGEAGRALAIAQGTARPLHALLRVNPPFELRGSGMRMGGGARAFGVDLEQAPDVLAMLAAGGAHVRGFHIFAGSQNLDAEAIADAQAATVTLAAELAAHLPGPPELVNLGGGFGLPYFAGDRPLDLARIGARLSETLARRQD